MMLGNLCPIRQECLFKPGKTCPFGCKPEPESTINYQQIHLDELIKEKECEE